MKKFLIFLLAFSAILIPACAEEEEPVYRLYSESGEYLTSRAGRMYEGDEYIAGDNSSWRIIRVDDETCTAYAEEQDPGEIDMEALALFSAMAEEKKLICMYSTHSDESYIPDDGDYSLEEDAGIFDVGRALKENLEKYGIEVVYSTDTFLPHDSGAYDRSRSTAEDLLKKSPDALFDIHRDGVDAEEYETTVDGEESSMVRLFVGRSNPNAAANKAFARQLKAVADEAYPGLIKDIYIGKGNYNQELYPQSILLEIGTHEIDKDLAITATEYLAAAINDTLYEGETPAEPGGASVSKGVIWAVIAGVVLVAVFALAATGRLSGAWENVKRGTSELTLGLFGKKRK